MKRAPKTGHTLRENLQTQPLVRHRVFNNHEVVTEGWYPVCPSRALDKGEASSHAIGYQRIVVYRGEDGAVRALDAFCPHMGADLGNGSVIGNELACYFHRWRFDERGACTGTGCADEAPKNARLESYPVVERHGFVWVFSAPVASHDFPSCPGLEGAETVALHLGRVRLYAHHHAMMAGGIDLQHFATVHDLDVDFDLEIEEQGEGVAEWRLRGVLPQRGLRARLGRRLIGDTVGYRLRVAGGSIAAISYGRQQRLFGSGPEIPSLHILWGCLPGRDGISEVEIFVVAEKRAGLRGVLASRGLMGLTVGLLAVLKDDDVKAFPNMRFNPRAMTKSDRSVARFIQHANRLAISKWSRPGPELVQIRSGEEAVDREDLPRDSRRAP